MKIFPLLGLLLLTACVTINIYFPAAAAEKAADHIIQDIQKNAPPTTDDDSRADNHAPLIPAWQHWLVNIVDVIVSPAYAESADLNIDSAEIRKLQATMQKRFSALLPFYQQGLIGIQSDGLLTIVDAGKVPLKDRNTANKLIAAENADRTSLYQAIANANGHPEWFDEIKATFAKRWIGNAKSGWFYQSNGQWVRK